MLWMEKDWNIQRFGVTFDQDAANRDLCLYRLMKIETFA